MANNKFPQDKYNQSGYKDTTAYQALLRVRREERQQLIAEVKALANTHGYQIVGIIRLRETNSDDS